MRNVKLANAFKSVSMLFLLKEILSFASHRWKTSRNCAYLLQPEQHSTHLAPPHPHASQYSRHGLMPACLTPLDPGESSGHRATLLPPTSKKRTPTRRCRLCWAHGRRKETRYQCLQCPTTPGLCAGQCFVMFHQARVDEWLRNSTTAMWSLSEIRQNPQQQKLIPQISTRNHSFSVKFCGWIADRIWTNPYNRAKLLMCNAWNLLAYILEINFDIGIYFCLSETKPQYLTVHMSKHLN